jgi:transposase
MSVPATIVYRYGICSRKKGGYLILVNVWFFKQMPGRKSNVKDTRWITKFLYENMLHKSYVPWWKIRILRNYN